MAKTKKEAFVLTFEEKKLFYEMSEFYLQHKLDKDADDTGKYMAYAKTIGEIWDSGDKYIENMRFYEVRTKILNYLDKQKSAIYDLRNKILNNT